MLCHHTWPSWHGPAVEVSGDDDDDDDDGDGDDDDDDVDMNVVHQKRAEQVFISSYNQIITSVHPAFIIEEKLMNPIFLYSLTLV